MQSPELHCTFLATFRGCGWCWSLCAGTHSLPLKHCSLNPTDCDFFLSHFNKVAYFVVLINLAIALAV